MPMIYHFQVKYKKSTLNLGECRGFGLPKKVFNMEHFTKDIMEGGKSVYNA